VKVFKSFGGSVAARKSRHAWVIYWENMPGKPSPKIGENEVVAILPIQWSGNRIKDVLIRMYLERAASPAELLEYRQISHAPYQPVCGLYLHKMPYGGLYVVGHNPILNAREAFNVVASNEYTIEWDEISPTHHAEFCRINFGIEDCEEAARGPVTMHRVWDASHTGEP